MEHSTSRILTTDAGSLPRPAELNAMFECLSRHEPVDHAALERDHGGDPRRHSETNRMQYRRRE